MNAGFNSLVLINFFLLNQAVVNFNVFNVGLPATIFALDKIKQISIIRNILQNFPFIGSGRQCMLVELNM